MIHLGLGRGRWMRRLMPQGHKLVSALNAINAAARLDQVGNALNEFMQLGFDVPNNTSTTSSARHVPTLSGSTPVPAAGGSFSSTQRLDSLRRPWRDVGNNGQQVAYGYDGNGNFKTRTDAAGRTTSYDYDAQNRLVRTTAGQRHHHLRLRRRGQARIRARPARPAHDLHLTTASARC
jgi:YD repeat-containing protein